MILYGTSNWHMVIPNRNSSQAGRLRLFTDVNMVCVTKMRMHMLYLLIFYMYSQKLLDTRYCAFIKVTEEFHFLQEIFRWCPLNNIGRLFKSIPSPSNENYSHEPSSNIIWQGGLQSNNFKLVLWQKHRGTGLPGCLVVETFLILTN